MFFWGRRSIGMQGGAGRRVLCFVSRRGDGHDAVDGTGQQERGGRKDCDARSGLSSGEISIKGYLAVRTQQARGGSFCHDVRVLCVWAAGGAVCSARVREISTIKRAHGVFDILDRADLVTQIDVDRSHDQVFMFLLVSKLILTKYASFCFYRLLQ